MGWWGVFANWLTCWRLGDKGVVGSVCVCVCVADWQYAYLLTDGAGDGEGERPDVATAQVVSLALVAEDLQLPLLLLIQRVAVAHLQKSPGSSVPRNTLGGNIFIMYIVIYSLCHLQCSTNTFLSLFCKRK